MKEKHHIGSHFLLLQAELELLRINESLENIFEDVTAFGRMPQHPVVQVVIRAVSFAYLFRMSNFKKLQSFALID